MSTHTAAIHAAIDLGSNSTKITVAVARGLAPQVDDTIEIIAHESTMIRLGESVNTTGEITPEKQDAVITTLQHYQQLAQKYEASSITVVATEAVRKAQNCQAFLNAVQQETGLTVQTVSGEIEATLTYLGAISDQQEIADAGVVDIGGGSTELIIAQQGHIQWLISLPIGSGWLHDHYLASDPPTAVEVDKARTFLNTYLHRLQLPEVPLAGQARRLLIATGSSAKILLALAQQALRVDKETQTLSRYDLLGCFGLLAALPAEEIARRYEQPFERARVLPSGALIFLALLDFLQLEEISVSQRGVSEGALLAAQRYGDSWLEQPDLKVDTTHIGKAPAVADVDQNNKPTTQSQQQSEKFVETGRRELRKRSETFVKCIDPVLQNTDVEAVHKMRVASRRLRATLDAYESACVGKPFKKVYQEVKQAADLLGTARDTDVMLQHLEQQQVPDNEQPGIQWLISRLQNYREQQQRAIAAFFKDFHSRRFQRSVGSCIPNGGSNRGKN
jgi:exopolyphosphatase/pppGpp-phosphohydrolase